MSEVAILNAVRSSTSHAFQLLVGRLLSEMQFDSVSLLDIRPSPKRQGKTGHQIECCLYTEFFEIRMLVKVIGTRLTLQHLDELSSTVNRLGAHLGLVVSAYPIERKARPLLAQFKRQRVHVLAGTRLARLLIEHQLGSNAAGEVDYPYFGDLETTSQLRLAFFRKGRHAR